MTRILVFLFFIVISQSGWTQGSEFQIVLGTNEAEIVIEPPSVEHRTFYDSLDENEKKACVESSSGWNTFRPVAWC